MFLTIFSRNQSWIFGQKVKISNSFSEFWNIAHSFQDPVFWKEIPTKIYGAHQFWETPLLVLKGLSLLCQRVQLDDEENQYWFTGLKSQKLARKGLKVEKLRKNPFIGIQFLVKVLKTKVCLKYLLVQSCRIFWRTFA